MANYSSNIIPLMTSATAPIPVTITSSGNSSTSTKEYMAFDRSVSTLWATATPSPDVFLKIDFGIAKRVGKYKISPSATVNRRPRKWSIQGSNDNITFITLDTRDYTTLSSSAIIDTFEFSNSTPYRYYKIKIDSNEAFADGSYTEIAEVEMYEILNINKILIQSTSDSEVKSIVNREISNTNAIPTMTSDTLPSGRAFASTFTSGYPPYRAFDKADVSIGWQNSATNGHIGYEFVEPKLIAKYAVRSTSDSAYYNQMPKDWTFEGSIDGVTWIVLDKQVGQSWSSVSTDKEYVTLNSFKYKMYRLNFSVNNGGVSSTVGEFKMYEESKPMYLVKTPSQNENDFIYRGMNSLSHINPKVNFEKKQYIKEQNITLGSGKTFSQPIDLKRYKVKKITFQ